MEMVLLPSGRSKTTSPFLLLVASILKPGTNILAPATGFPSSEETNVMAMLPFFNSFLLFCSVCFVSNFLVASTSAN